MIHLETDGRVRVAPDGDLAPETIRAYEREWERWERWCVRNHAPSLGARQRDMVAHFDEMIRVHGLSPAAVRQAGAAIRRAHQDAGMDLAHAMRATTIVLRRAGREGLVARPKQARPIRRNDVRAICEILDGRHRNRMADRDRAILLVGYCGLLRVSDMAALEWPDLQVEEDGTGRLEIRRSKNDQDGTGALVFLAVDAVEALHDWRDWRMEGSPDQRIFCIGPVQITRRIQQMASMAGIKGVSGHSLRVGCAHDLLDSGASPVQLQLAGRWRSPAMPAYYARGSEAGSGAVASMLGEGGTVV